VLEQLAVDHQEEKRNASRIILEDFYSYSWTLMHYGQYKKVALTTPSNACYARSPKPFWQVYEIADMEKDDIT